MKTTIFPLVLIMAVAGTVIPGEQPSGRKMETLNFIRDVNQEINSVTQNEAELARVQRETIRQEWEAFLCESELKIRENEVLIQELKIKTKGTHRIIDAVQGRKEMSLLEQRNKELRRKIDSYYLKDVSHWENFMSGFKTEVKEFELCMKDFLAEQK